MPALNGLGHCFPLGPDTKPGTTSTEAALLQASPYWPRRPLGNVVSHKKARVLLPFFWVLSCTSSQAGSAGPRADHDGKAAGLSSFPERRMLHHGRGGGGGEASIPTPSPSAGPAPERPRGTLGNVARRLTVRGSDASTVSAPGSGALGAAGPRMHQLCAVPRARMRRGIRTCVWRRKKSEDHDSEQQVQKSVRLLIPMNHQNARSLRCNSGQETVSCCHGTIVVGQLITSLACSSPVSP